MPSSKPSLSSQASQTRFNMGKSMEEQKKKRVLVVGAGAAGMSCAEHLSNHPDKFDVTLVDAVDYCGGQAFSIPLDKNKYGASWMNQGVQGGSYIFHHTLTMFARNGFKSDPVELQVSFGKGDQFWTNVFPTKMLKKHEGEVKRFYWMIKVTRWFELLFAILPIKYLVKLWGFSTEFANVVALPMIALFLGTGNYTPEVPSIVLERVITSPTYGMWVANKARIMDNLPKMVVFPCLSDFYSAWKDRLIKKGVNIRLSTEVTRVVKRDSKGVVVKTIKRTPTEDGHNPDSAWVPHNTEGYEGVDADAKEMTEEYDEIVLCVLTDTANRILKPVSTLFERRTLGVAKFANDVSITHTDTEYMKKYYENFYNEDLAVANINGQDCSKDLEFAKKNFKPMYYIRSYQEDLSKIEMNFDVSNYQSQFPPNTSFDKHIFQTIFLNKDRDRHLWVDNEIDKSKIIETSWWHQLCHRWQHYAFLIPFMPFIQGHKHTRYAASWTMLNAHEVAIMSGIAAAVDLGAAYPEDLERDRFAFLAFRCYYFLAYYKFYRRRATKHTREGPGADWAEGENTYGSTYNGPGANRTIDRLTWQQEVEKGRSLKSFD